jgi:hypothetical protein
MRVGVWVAHTSTTTAPMIRDGIRKRRVSLRRPLKA